MHPKRKKGRGRLVKSKHTCAREVIYSYSQAKRTTLNLTIGIKTNANT